MNADLWMPNTLNGGTNHNPFIFIVKNFEVMVTVTEIIPEADM
jgi:hypothetical protein